MRFAEESAALKNSQWPRCDALALELATRGPAAADALEAAATSRVHHVRTAALKCLFHVDESRGRALAQSLLHDRAFEVRETAANILGVRLSG
jgi:hypothetical protein